MLAACLAFRNSARYLREWLLFHRAVGFERFYLYNNDSTDDFLPALAPWLRDGTVVLVDWPGYHQQNAIYDAALRRALGDGVEWLAFIDDDEFLYATDPRPLREILRDFEPFAGVAVSWLCYGSSGQIHRGDDAVIRRFTRRAARPDPHVKCLVRPPRIVRTVNGGHQFEPQPGFVVVDETKAPLRESLNPRPSADVLRVNHYLVKSIEEMIERRTARDIGYGDKQKLALLEWLRLDRGWNDLEDASAQQFEREMQRLARDSG